MPSIQDLRDVFSGHGSSGGGRGEEEEDSRRPWQQEQLQHQQKRPPRHSPQPQQPMIPPRPTSSSLYDITSIGRRNHHHASNMTAPSDESHASESPPHRQRQHHHHHHVVTVSPPPLHHQYEAEEEEEEDYQQVVQQRESNTSSKSNHTGNTSSQNNNLHHGHSWDSDRQFPLAEIQRIKNKTKKLRKGQDQAAFDNNNPDNEDDDGFQHLDGIIPAFSSAIQQQQRGEAKSTDFGELPSSTTVTRSFYSDDNTGGEDPQRQQRQGRKQMQSPPPPQPVVSVVVAGEADPQLYGGPRSIRRIKNPNYNNNNQATTSSSHPPTPPGMYRNRSWSSNTSGQQQQQQQQRGGGGGDSRDSLAEVLDETEEPSESTSSGGASSILGHRGNRSRRRRANSADTPSTSSDIVVRRAQQELMDSFKKPRGRSTSRSKSKTNRTSTSRATTATSASSTPSSRKGGGGRQRNFATPPINKPRHYSRGIVGDGDDEDEFGFETLLNTSNQDDEPTTDLDVSNEEAFLREAAVAADMENHVVQHQHSDRSSGSKNLALHDLCGEAVSPNDVAWRNALYLLSVQPELARIVMDDSSLSPTSSSTGTGAGWTALHISCMGQEPPPTFMTRALLYCHGKAAQIPDAGGRYPLHLVAASSGDAETMQLLVQEYPQAIYKMDHHGMTPLHLLIRNTAVELTVENVQVLLQGFTPNNNSTSRNKNHKNNNNNANQHLLQRRGEHLNLRIEELNRLHQSQRQLPQTIFHRYNNAYFEQDHFDNKSSIGDVDDEFEAEFDQYPQDVQVSLRRLSQGKRHERRQRQVRRHWARKKNQPIPIDNATDDDDEAVAVPLEYENSDYYYYFQNGDNGEGGGLVRLCETNPAAIPTRHGGLMELPLHMIVRRGLVEQTPLAADINATWSSSSSTRRHGRQRSRSSSAGYRHDSNIVDADMEQGTNGDIAMDDTYFSDDDDDAIRVSSSRQKTPPPSIPNVFEVIRTVIAAYPPALAFRDAQGLTPLLKVMLLDDSLPSLDVIDLLLGKRSLGYKSIPSWAQDMPLHRFLLEPSSSSSNSILENPAMVPTTDTNQLPLHVAAEELLMDVSLIQTIYEAYPAAIKVQDSRGRTPLHLALKSYRRIPPNPKILSMLMRDSTVAQIRDDDGNLPFDLLVQSANTFPLTMPRSWTQSSLDKYAPPDGVTDAATVYTKFFQASMLGTARPKNKAEAKYFLERLRGLPPWLQRQACGANFVQELLVEELSSPWKCAVILLDGLLLALLVTVFRIQIKEFIDSREANIHRSSLYTYLVYCTAALRLVIQAVFCALVRDMGQLRHLVLANGWWWMDYSAMGLSMVTSVLLNGSLHYNTLLTLSTVVTALLWLTVLAYLSHWSYGTAVFMGMLGKITRYMFWPMITLVIVVIGFAQLFFTLLHVDGNCANAMGDTTPVCTARDAYRVMYLLLFFNNDALIDASGESQMSPQATMLVAVFIGVLVLVLLGLLVMAVITALESDVFEIAMRSYWEPKMAFVLSAYDVGGFFCCYQQDQQRYSYQPSSCEDRCTMRLARAWDLVMLSLSPSKPSFSAEPTAADASATPDRQNKLWYTKTAQAATASRQQGSFSSFQAILAWPLWIVSIILVPIWLVLGLFTLGWLWPPQVRRWLFEPKGFYNVMGRHRRGHQGGGGGGSGGDVVGATMEYTSTQLSGMRTEMNNIKTMSYEQSGNIEREIRGLKELLYYAMKEE